MKAWDLTDWRRWIATLCVALVAFVMVERAFAADPCHVGIASVFYNIAETITLADSGNDPLDERAPIQTQRVHCCSAHIAGMPPAPQAGAVVQIALSVKAPLTDAAAPHGEQAGQDRPPRMSAIA